MNAQRNVNKKSTQTGDIRTENREPAIIYINCHFLALAYLLFVCDNSVGLMVVKFGV
jgi:hypothetical protein